MTLDASREDGFLDYLHVEGTASYSNSRPTCKSILDSDMQIEFWNRTGLAALAYQSIRWIPA